MKRLRENKKFAMGIFIAVELLPFLLTPVMGSLIIPVVTYKTFRPFLNYFQVIMLIIAVVLGKFVFKFTYKFHWKQFFQTLLLLTPIILFMIYREAQRITWIKKTFSDSYLQKPILVGAAILLIGMLHEEFVERGLLLTLAQKYFTLKTPFKTNVFAVLLTGILFGVGHLISLCHTSPWLDLYPSLYQVLYAAGFGCLFGSVYVITKNIWALVLIHFLYDFVEVTNMFLYWDAPWQKEAVFIPFDLNDFLWALGQFVVGIGIALVYLYVYDKKQNKSSISFKKRQPTS